MDGNTKVHLAVEAPLATITLNRPEKLNAIDPEMLALLEDACARLEREQDVRVVLLTGAGERAFSVGADINAWSSLDPLQMWRWWVRPRPHYDTTYTANGWTISPSVDGTRFSKGSVSNLVSTAGISR